MIAQSQQKRKPVIDARNQGTSPVTVPMRILVLEVSVTALEPVPNVTNAERKAILPAIALPVVLVVGTADTAAAKATAVADTVEDVLPTRIATHAEASATWPGIALKGRDRSVTTAANLGI